MVETSLAASPTDGDPIESDFFTENMAAFREHAPLLHSRLRQIETTFSRLIVDDDGVIDIVFGDQRFYGMDAVKFTQLQIDAYFEGPERRYIKTIALNDLDSLEGRYKSVLTTMLGAESANLSERRTDITSHFTIVFGLGLGLHLDPLLAFTACAELIIIEPNFENLYHSLFVIDWRALFEAAGQAGCAIHLVLEKDQDLIAARLRTLIRLGNPALIDGVYVYQHYGSSLMTEAHETFNRDYSMHVMGLGFFEDEMLMMANAVTNLKQNNVRILASQQHPRSEPVFICGSGPSIDGVLEVIAAQRDRALVVSMGSGLRTLLAYGIRPDLHVETENHPTNCANVQRVASEFDLSGITLLGAATVQPAMIEMFDETVLYFRESQSPSAVFGDSANNMGTSGPTVANAAMVTLSHMGFRNIYLLGVDMGSRSIKNYHSADTYIGKGVVQEWAGSERLPLPANFGGEALAESILDWSRLGLELVLKMNPGIHCVNCSDGARIACTIPMLPRVLDLSNAPLDHAQVMDDVRGKMQAFPLELMKRVWRDSEVTKASQDIFAGIDTILASAAKLDDPGLEWAYELYYLLEETKVKSPANSIFLFGTTCLFLASFWWFDGRIVEAQIRCRYRQTAVQELRKVYASMERRLAVLLTDTGRCVAGEIPAVEAGFDI